VVPHKTKHITNQSFSIHRQASLQRLAWKDPNGCKKAFKSLLNAGRTNPTWSAFHRSTVDKDDFMLAAKVQKMESFEKAQMFCLISNIYDSVSEDEGDENAGDYIDSARSLYLTVVKEYAYITLPVFRMRWDPLRAVSFITVIIFEPRYLMLVREVMEGRKPSEFRGRQLAEPRPQFIFAHHTRFGAGATAFLVEISQCRMLESGRFHITIKPLKKVTLVSVSERPGVDNGLHDAQIKRFK